MKLSVDLFSLSFLYIFYFYSNFHLIPPHTKDISCVKEVEYLFKKSISLLIIIREISK